MEQSQLKSLEKQICSLNDAPGSKQNRLAMREAILGMHELLKGAETVKEYSKIESALDASLGLLRLKYRDTVPLEYVNLPKEIP